MTTGCWYDGVMSVAAAAAVLLLLAGLCAANDCFPAFYICARACACVCMCVRERAGREAGVRTCLCRQALSSSRLLGPMLS